MTNLEKAFNGGMTREEADEVFSKLTTAEALELLKEDISISDEVSVFIEAPYIDYKDLYKKSKDVELDIDNRQMKINIEKYDHFLTVYFKECEVEAFSDYDTTDEDSLDESKTYFLKLVDNRGNVEG